MLIANKGLNLEVDLHSVNRVVSSSMWGMPSSRDQVVTNVGAKH